MQFVDFGDGNPVRAFVCTAPNPWGYPAKDRAGRLDQIEEPHLGRLIGKLVGPATATHSSVFTRAKLKTAGEEEDNVTSMTRGRSSIIRGDPDGHDRDACNEGATRQCRRWTAG